MMKTETHQIEIFGNFIQSLRMNRKLTLGQGLAELIDNSIDAKAKRITIAFDQATDNISIIDDGIGCQDLRRFAQFGASQEVHADAFARVGRYGVGGKHASAMLADQQRIVSVSGGFKRSAIIPWGKMSTENGMDWQFIQPERTSEDSGTAIYLTGIAKGAVNSRYFSPISIQKNKEYWRKIYLPSLKSGLKVTVDGDELQPLPIPKLIHSRPLSGEFHGKKYTGLVGVLEDYTNDFWDAGWYVSCAGRLMNEKALHDSFEDWPGSQVWGYFNLVESKQSKWSLDTNKLDFAEREDFFAMIVPQIIDLMELGQEQGTTIETGQLEDQHSEGFASAFGGAAHVREKRGPKENQTGTVHPIDSSKRREKAEKIHPERPGSVLDDENKKQSVWRVIFKHMGGKEICKATIQKRSRWVEFDVDNPFVAQHRRHTATLIGIAAFAFWDEATEAQRHQLWASTMESDELEMHEQNIERARLKWIARALARYTENTTRLKKTA